VQLEVLGQFKNPMTSSGIKPATFQLIFYCFFIVILVVTVASIMTTSQLKMGVESAPEILDYQIYPENGQCPT
jgi:hypothetical protein